MNRGMDLYNLATEFYNRLGLSNTIRMAQIYCFIGEWHEISGNKELVTEYFKRAVEIEGKTLTTRQPPLLSYRKV